VCSGQNSKVQVEKSSLGRGEGGQEYIWARRCLTSQRSTHANENILSTFQLSDWQRL
jgi:hypothetical protein